MKIATWNIYWLGDRHGEHIVRTPEDEGGIAQVIENLSPDVLALEEVVDPLVMERVLGRVNGPGRNYVIRTSPNAWLSSHRDPTDVEDAFQKVFLCINTETVEFVRGVAVRGGPGRKPYAAVLRYKPSGREFVAVAAHLRAGYPDFLNEHEAGVRRQEAASLSRWLRGEAQAAQDNPGFASPVLDEVVVLGDFNARIDDPNHSLDPLREGALADWTWEKPRPDGQRWETAIFNGDRLVIDFIMLSPAMAQSVAAPPTIYAWDLDPTLGGPLRFHDEADGTDDLKGYGVSDHRPVYTVLDF
jgi:endonuclease/exonuclease/phosphatase family metal-dependent hydrolase